jgi:protein-S-isoprenylcysteine O-methyltransferase Ste14
MKALENRIPPPILMILVGAAMWGLSHLPPHVPLSPALRIAVACGVASVGVLFLAAGFLAFRKAGTTIDPVNIERASTLVSSGIFRVSRNPMYVGFTALLLGWSVYLAGAWAFVGPVFYVLYITRLQIVPEERAMLQRFGSQYIEYRSATRRWL